MTRLPSTATTAKMVTPLRSAPRTPERPLPGKRKARSRLQLDERRAQLLELGLKLFSTRAYTDLSIDEVAAAAGISKGLLYHYFPGKQEFYVAVIREAARRLQQFMVPQPSLSPAARLGAAIDAHLDYAQAYGPLYSAIYTSGVGMAPEVGAVVAEHRRMVLRHFLHDFKLSRPRPIVRGALRAWMSMLEGASLDWISHPELERSDLRALLLAGHAALMTKAQALDRKAPGGLGKARRSGRA